MELSRIGSHILYDWRDDAATEKAKSHVYYEMISPSKMKLFGVLEEAGHNQAINIPIKDRRSRIGDQIASKNKGLLSAMDNGSPAQYSQLGITSEISSMDGDVRYETLAGPDYEALILSAKYSLDKKPNSLLKKLRKEGWAIRKINLKMLLA